MLESDDTIFVNETKPYKHVDVASIEDLEDYVWSWLYVSEGSRLGGEYIYRQLSRHFSGDSIQYLQFFSALNEKDKRRWDSLVETMEWFYGDKNRARLEKLGRDAGLHFDTLLHHFNMMQNANGIMKNRVQKAGYNEFKL